MAAEKEPAKLLLPYLQRADELQKHEPLVGYYCRLYAMERGLRIPNGDRTKTTNALLVSLMNQLEKDKKSLTLGPDDHLHVEGFALNVFGKADKQDRAGRADLNTAKTFYAASIFFEILNQFGEIQPDLEQKHKYAVWKAADIRKALKEGRKPVPGPPGGEDIDSTATSIPKHPPPTAVSIFCGGLEMIPICFILQGSEPVGGGSSFSAARPAEANERPDEPDPYPQNGLHHVPPSGSYATGDVRQPPIYQTYYPQQYQPDQLSLPDAPSFSYPNFQSYPSFSESSLPTAPVAAHYPSYHRGPDSPAYPSSSPGNSGGRDYEYDTSSSYQPPPERIAEAHKAARFAVGALAFDDVSVAVDFLKKSLELLTNPSAGQ
ncbi:hypothetical protein M569_10088 [Genlisea aurea]|uniref:Vta1/callose synthase N-terminal domain-containing protein n=1 Tax=Genlisea aurea TaxID=192259 RepID=S8DNT6_9LAMI|nr:hypothetical protein M569_10088 [Genlisea aurea]